MVLRHILIAAILLAGCKQSLFADHGGGDDVTGDANGSGSDGTVQSMCGAGCLGDAVADFGTAKWQYFDDHRNRTWAAMTKSGNAYVGANPANKIAQGSDALLVSTAGMGDGADPAIAFTSTMNQTIKLSIIVDIPASAGSHTVRLYRNSREDSLFTKIGLGGSHVETSIVVDALAGDRFLLALAPNGNSGGTDVPVKFFVNETTMQFPTECKFAMQFESVSAHGSPNACGGEANYQDTTANAMPALGQGPFPELGMAASITLDHYFTGPAPINRSGDTTTQFWIKHRAFGTESATLFSDQDCDSPDGGGLVIYKYLDISTGTGGMIGFQTCTGPQTADYRSVNFPNEFEWHFIRVVQHAGALSLCVDGASVSMFTPMNASTMDMSGVNPPYLGKNVDYSPTGAYLDALMDDVRVVSTALPCP